jgi:RNA-directed DNA polymerase
MGELLQQIAHRDNLRTAFTKVKTNRGAPGVDRKSVAAFEANLESELASLARRLLSQERYQPPPVRRVEIAKPDGGSRPLGIPTVGDRVVQQATLQIIGPLFEEVFEDCSYGFRPQKGPKAALAKVKGHIAQGDRWVAEFDIEGFFDNLSHRRLLRHFGKVVSDAEVVGLVRRWLKAGVVTADGFSHSETGTPQGGVISPLLANVYLHRLDQEMQQAGFRFVRYADDFIVTANRRWKVRLADQLVRHVLDDIGLSLNEAKTGIRNLSRDEIDFLGFTFYAGRFLRPRKRALAAFKERIRNLTRRKRGMSLQAIITSLNPVIRGWGNYFVEGHVAGLFEDLDGWIRMRVRSYVLGRPSMRTHINRWMTTATLHDRLGLVSLVALRRRHLSPAPG